MNYISRILKYVAAACVSAMIGIAAVTSFAQEKEQKDKSKTGSYRGFCSNDSWSSNEKISFTDLRELTLRANGSLSLDGGRNGGISVKGEDRGDILVRACVQAWGRSEAEAKAEAANIRVSTSGTIKAESSATENNWGVSFEILVPRSTNLTLTANNGGISISGVDGTADFETTNGGINVKNVSGDVKGRTKNGGVNVSLTGTSWRGSGLDVETKNGGVNLTLPANYSANVETGTVNGGFMSEFPSLNVTTEDYKGDNYGRSRSKRILTSLNGGGAPIRIITTNGGVKINTTDN